MTAHLSTVRLAIHAVTAESHLDLIECKNNTFLLTLIYEVANVDTMPFHFWVMGDAPNHLITIVMMEKNLPSARKSVGLTKLIQFELQSCKHHDQL